MTYRWMFACTATIAVTTLAALTGFVFNSRQEESGETRWDDAVLLSGRNGTDNLTELELEMSFDDFPAQLVEQVYPHNQDEFWVVLDNAIYLASLEDGTRRSVHPVNPDTSRQRRDRIGYVNEQVFAWSTGAGVRRPFGSDSEYGGIDEDGPAIMTFEESASHPLIRTISSTSGGEIVGAPFRDNRIRVYDPIERSGEEGGGLTGHRAYEEGRILLGRPGDSEADFVSDEEYGEILSLLAMPHGQLVFVAVDPEPILEPDGSPSVHDTQLWLFDDGELTQLEVSSPDYEFGRGPYFMSALVYDSSDTAEQPPVQMLNRGPDDTILAVSGGDEAGHSVYAPAIWTIDPLTGESDLILELEGVTPNDIQPISAAAVGDDLVFTAEGELWLLEDAFTAEDT